MGNAATGRSEGAREVVSSEVDSVGTMKQHRNSTGGFAQWSGISAFAQNEVRPLQLLQICRSNKHVPLGDIIQIKVRLEDFRKCSQSAKR